MDSDTIFAEATVPGRGGVSVIRISGPKAWAVGARMVGDLGPARMSALRVIRDPETGDVLDSGLVLAFEAGASFTGEAVVELQLHGSRAVVKRVLAVLAAERGLRFAQAGEFTRRAMENGRLDLAQVEALGDLIDAETEAQRIQALRGLEGELGRQAMVWREDLTQAAGLAAAALDFADEDIPDTVISEIIALIAKTRVSLEIEIRGAGVAERVRSGFEVAIVGRPNVGKSTLLNSLARRDVAITSDIAGTTRDVLEVVLDLGGHAVTFLDMAGVRDADDHVERLGVDRALKRASGADIRVFLLEGQDTPEMFGLVAEDGDLSVSAKGDLRPDAVFPVSGATGLGVEALCAYIGETFAERASVVASAAGLRQKQVLEEAFAVLGDAEGLFADELARVDIGAEQLRTAIYRLDVLIGRVDVEDMLDVVFKGFCIGK